MDMCLCHFRSLIFLFKVCKIAELGTAKACFPFAFFYFILFPEALAKGCTFQTNLQKSVRSHRNYLSSTLLFFYLPDVLQIPVNLLDFVYLAVLSHARLF